MNRKLWLALLGAIGLFFMTTSSLNADTPTDDTPAQVDQNVANSDGLNLSEGSSNGFHHRVFRYLNSGALYPYMNYYPYYYFNYSGYYPYYAASLNPYLFGYGSLYPFTSSYYSVPVMTTMTKTAVMPEGKAMPEDKAPDKK